LTDLSGRTLKMLEEQLGMEERIADTYSYYSSQAGNPALSTMLNQFVREKAREMEALRGLIGERGKRTDAFEEQVYQNQAGGPNPGGYRPGGTAGTETIGPRARGRRAGDNLGFEAAQLEFGWYEPVRGPESTVKGQPQADAVNGHIPWVTSDDHAIIHDVMAKERQLDVGYSSIACALPEGTARDTVLKIREDIRHRIERMGEAARG
jgi:hypothetical protein